MLSLFAVLCIFEVLNKNMKSSKFINTRCLIFNVNVAALLIKIRLKHYFKADIFSIQSHFSLSLFLNTVFSAKTEIASPSFSECL